MRTSRSLAITTLAAAMVIGPVVWALPSGLSAWRTAGIVFGWIGVGLLIVSLLLMLREPRLADALGGLERMYRWHHGTGLAAYVALLLHPLALAGDAWNEMPRVAWQLLSPADQGWPVRTGWVSLLCLMVGVGTSLSTRLAYPRWRLLHGLLGVGVVLGVVHLVLLGLDATGFMAIVATLVLLTSRTLRIDLGLSALPYVVSSVDHVAATTVEIGLRPLARALVTTPGQFVMVAFMDGPHFRGCREYHPFTVSAVAPDGELDIGIKALGDCTQVIQTLQTGVAARIQGPFGTFLAERPPMPALWVAGGIGVTPFVAALRASPPLAPTTLLYLFRSEADAAYLDELRRMASTMAAFDLVERATGDVVPDIGEALPTNLDPNATHCYLCGPPGLIQATLPVLHARGIPSDRIHYERFDFR